MPSVKIIILSALVLLTFLRNLEAGWLVYHVPEIRGKVVDVDTHEPINRAVIVVKYHRKIVGIGASMSYVLEVKETLSSENGEFCFESFTKLIQPLSWQSLHEVMIYKPGFSSVEINGNYFANLRWKEREGTWAEPALRRLKYKLPGSGVVELPRAATKEQRVAAMRNAYVFGPDVPKEKLPTLLNYLTEEQVHLGTK